MITVFIIAGLVLFTSALYLWVKADFKKWKAEKAVLHTHEWILKAASLTPAILLFTLAIRGRAPVIIELLFVVIMLMAWWWFFFDGFYNVKRNFKWFFTGSNDADDPKSDNFLQAIKPWQRVAVKVGFLLLTTLRYILFLIL